MSDKKFNFVCPALRIRRERLVTFEGDEREKETENVRERKKKKREREVEGEKERDSQQLIFIED